MKTVLCDPYLSDECKNSILGLGYSVKEIPAFDRLPKPISSHPDILLFKLKDGSLLMGDEYYRINSDFYDSLGIKIVTDTLSPQGEYPSDVLFDALAVKDTLYGKKAFVSQRLTNAYSEFVTVKQGYARCSVALLNESSAITADKGLSEALKKDGVNVLDIRSGHIVLEGYNFGFIGGAGGRLDDGLYCFFGNVEAHPDGEAILDFCHKKKINAVSLSGGPLCDRGGILVL